MEDMAVARINGKIISWALRRSGASLASLTHSTVSLGTLEEWVSGKTFPSEGQAEDLADRLGIAYPMLFMQSVPADEPIKIPDLRRVDGKPLSSPSLALLDVLDYTRARQKWFHEEMKESGQKPLSFVAKFSQSSLAEPVATDMRDALQLDNSLRRESKGYEEFLKSLIANAEKIGILVMRSAVVGHSTKRTLKVAEFRGFAMPDPLAPIVFINDSDAKAAQVFTFAHEVAHIWIGAGGISDRTPNERGSSSNAIETLCDAIAAEFLIPASELLKSWQPSLPIDRNLLNANARFNTSTLAILRRAKDLHLISLTQFFDKVNEQYEIYRSRERAKLGNEGKSEKKKKGGNFWNSFELRNGKKFNAAVAAAVREQRTTYAEAGKLFGVNPVAASKYVQSLGSR